MKKFKDLTLENFYDDIMSSKFAKANAKRIEKIDGYTGTNGNAEKMKEDISTLLKNIHYNDLLIDLDGSDDNDLKQTLEEKIGEIQEIMGKFESDFLGNKTLILEALAKYKLAYQNFLGTLEVEDKQKYGTALRRLFVGADAYIEDENFRQSGLKQMTDALNKATGIVNSIKNGDKAKALKELQAIKLDPNPKTPFEKALTVFKYAVGITLVLGVVGAALFFSGGLAAIPLIGFLGAGGPAMFAAGFGAAAGYATFAASTMAAGFMSVAAPSAFTIGIMGASVNALYLGVAAVVTGAVGYLYRDKIFGKSQEVKAGKDNSQSPVVPNNELGKNDTEEVGVVNNPLHQGMSDKLTDNKDHNTSNFKDKLAKLKEEPLKRETENTDTLGNTKTEGASENKPNNNL